MHSYSNVGYWVGKGVGRDVGSWDVGRSVGLGEGIDDGLGLGAGVGCMDGIGLGAGDGITEGLGDGDWVGYPLGAAVGASVSNISQVTKLDDISIKKVNPSEKVPSRNSDHSYGTPVATVPFSGYSENTGWSCSV